MLPRRFLTLCLIGAALAPLACEKSDPPRSANTGASGTSGAAASTAAPKAGNGAAPADASASPTSDAAAARALAGLTESAAAAAGDAASQALPAGHPPIPGTTSPQPASTADSSAAPSDAASPAGAIKWSVPGSWQAQPPASPMRKAQYGMPAAEGDPESGLCVVTLLGGGAGGVDANVARWVAQFRKADGSPLAAEDVKREDREIGGLKVTRVEMSGRFTDAMTGRSTTTTTDFRLLGAIIVAPDGLWFFKATGPDATMRSHTPAFDEMLASLTQ
ncbi:MAG: hypothetical protein IPM64_05850 [Phycisphaerales bacterium]|nr:hypothetical protein [Phycisphaerales bacterium]